MHRHKCKFCAFVWQHHNINDVAHGTTGAHECPSCHRCNWGMGIYDGPEPARVTNGAVGETEFVEIHPEQDKYFR